MSFKDLYELVKENIISALIIIYMLYDKNIIRFRNKDDDDKNQQSLQNVSNNTNNVSNNTNNDISTSETKLRLDMLETTSKTNIDEINKKIYEITKMLDNIKNEVNNNRLMLETTKGDFKSHEISIDNITKRLEDLNNILSTVETTLNNVCIKIAEISSKTTEFDKRLTSINEDLNLIKHSKLINGDLKNGFR